MRKTLTAAEFDILHVLTGENKTLTQRELASYTGLSLGRE